MHNAATLEGIVLERSFLIPRSAVMVLLVLLMCTAASFGQKASEPSNSSVMFSVRATHVWGSKVPRTIRQGHCPFRNVYCAFKWQASPLCK